MNLIKPSFEILSFPDLDGLKLIEKAGRTCYKSEAKITDDSVMSFLGMLVKRGHLSVIEHVNATVRFICDRGVSHELVRHRLASFSQESTRYVNYHKGEYGGDISFIRPCFFPEGSELWEIAMEGLQHTEDTYNRLVAAGARPGEARYALPNGLKTEIVVTTNFRHWMEIFHQRTAKAAHPQMREIMIPVYKEFVKRCPVIFDLVNKSLDKS
ncbi:FAD-dependent thymidylate synthase [Candidatus Pacearchaeota archaeon]|nr:FAD-dependent thymidylate synthase [Candidatus Pacearchaeota archaeon]